MCRVLNKHHAGVPAGRGLYRARQQVGQSVSDRSDGDRAAVIAKYELWLADQHQLLRALDEFPGLRSRLLLRTAAVPRRSAAAARQCDAR